MFKIVPFLNPDGVYNGLYRSDTLGHNLNRVYLNPRLDTQPSIYAVRKIIRFVVFIVHQPTAALTTLFLRFYHFGFDKPDNVDEIGQPIGDEGPENSLFLNEDCQEQQENDYEEEIMNEQNLKKDVEPEVVEQTVLDVEDVKEEQQDEGIKTKVTLEKFPQINPEKQVHDDPVVTLKRSDSALNIFDQTTILKLFSAKNWTETFFNRIFRKKFLVISPGAEALASFRSGLGLEQQMMHISQNYPRDFLPAIASERDKNLTNGLFIVLLLIAKSFACVERLCSCKLKLVLVAQLVERGSSNILYTSKPLCNSLIQAFKC